MVKCCSRRCVKTAPGKRLRWPRWRGSVQLVAIHCTLNFRIAPGGTNKRNETSLSGTGFDPRRWRECAGRTRSIAELMKTEASAEKSRICTTGPTKQKAALPREKTRPRLTDQPLRVVETTGH